MKRSIRRILPIGAAALASLALVAGCGRHFARWSASRPDSASTGSEHAAGTGEAVPQDAEDESAASVAGNVPPRNVWGSPTHVASGEARAPTEVPLRSLSRGAATQVALSQQIEPDSEADRAAVDSCAGDRTAQPEAALIGNSRRVGPNPIATPDTCRAYFLGEIQERVMHAQEAAGPELVPDELPEIPSDFQPWWHDQVVASQRKRARLYPVKLETLVLGALRHSPYVQAISDTPLARETTIVEAHAAFDPRAFMESKWVDTSEPVGSTLTTGGAPRFRDHNWTYAAGLRKKTFSGGQLEASQRIGFQDTNSSFFVPDPQGTGRLTLSFSQPLLNGAGRVYNESLIVLAGLSANIAKDELAVGLQDHLLEVTRAYWELYLQRAVLQQKRRLYQQAEAILKELENRREIDSLQSQIVRARAAVAARHAEIIRAETEIRNAESRIRVLVNDPTLLSAEPLELVPLEGPSLEHIEIGSRDSVLTALEHRPEIDAAIKNVRAAGVRLDASKNELLPVLNLVLQTYVAGLEGDGDIGTALGNQFSEGEPSYSVGLVFEVPLGNRAARAVHERRRIELRQLTSQFRATVENVTAEVEVAVREVNSSYREMQSKYRSMTASEAEVSYTTERWRVLPGDDRAASFLLEDLLDAQERLADEQFGFLKTQVSYNLALTNLKRVTGTLLQYENVTAVEACEDGTPRLMLDKREK